MSDESYIQSLFADRLGGSQFGKDTKIYKFEKIKRAKRAAQDANPDKILFDMGVGEPDEMAALIEFLLSPVAGYITGQTIHSDGGMSL